MHDSGTHIGDDIADAVEETLDDVTGSLRRKGSEVGRKAAETFDDGRAAAARSLHGAARGLHRQADAIAAGAERFSRATHGVADRVDSASRYVREHDARTMLTHVEAQVRRHPARSLLVALVLGFLAGRAFRSEAGRIGG